MPYVTIYKSAKGKEISLEQILCQEVDLSKPRKKRYYPGTVTRFYPSLPADFYSQGYIQHLIRKLEQLPLMSHNYPSDISGQYRFFQIPKRSGKMRNIAEPKRELYADQVELRTLFEKEFNAAYHTSAFAYCKGRSTLHCVRRHQAVKNKWFLKIDFSDFFGSTKPEFVWNQLSQIAPFSEIIKNDRGAELLQKSLSICYLNSGLPQGTPISPMLTNLVMIPIDHEISNRLHKMGFTYTRYADDIQISHRCEFDVQKVISIIQSVLANHSAPYVIKPEKTRYGSSSGRNWNLGLMLNRNNQITVGYRQHKLIKARLCNFIMDDKNQHKWTKKSVQKLSGQLAYFYAVEPQTMQYIVDHLNQKYNVSIKNMLSKYLNEDQMFVF